MKIPFLMLWFLAAGAVLLSGWLLTSAVLGLGGPGMRHELRRYLQSEADRERMQRRLAALWRARDEKEHMVKKLMEGEATFAEAAEAMRSWSEWVNEQTPETHPLSPVPPDEQACWERVLLSVTLQLKFHPRKDGEVIVHRLRGEMRQRFPDRQPRPWPCPGMEDWNTPARPAGSAQEAPFNPS